MDQQVGDLGVASIEEINALPADQAEALYLRLIPEPVLSRLAVDPHTLCDGEGRRLVRVTAPSGQPWARVELRASADDRDAAYLIDVEMSTLAVPELAFVQLTDPGSPRYAIDLSTDGDDTLFGTVGRNVDEEVRAMRAGLAPGQVRRGLRLLGSVLDAMSDFARLLGHEIFLIEPLFYHSAVLYERRGCGYVLGRDRMEAIDAGFRAGGELHRRLDGSTDFRRVGAEGSVRGRSWALHDGLWTESWGGRWSGIKMYKAAGRQAGVSTASVTLY